MNRTPAIERSHMFHSSFEGWRSLDKVSQVGSVPVRRVGTVKGSHDFFNLTSADEDRFGSHGERFGDSGRSQPWAFCGFHTPTLPSNTGGADIAPSAMSADYIADMPNIGMSAPAHVATKSRIFIRGLLLVGFFVSATLRLSAQDKVSTSPPAASSSTKDSAAQPKKETSGEARKKELYGNVSEELEPFGRFVQEPYHRYFVPSDAAITFWGPGRDKPEPEVPTVKIGLLAPLDRSHETYMGISIKRGTEMAIEEANANGGYKSKPFEMVVRNDSGLWGASANEIVSFTYDDKVWAVIGTVDGANTHIAIRVALRTDLPMMNVADLDATLMETRIPWVFRVVPDDRQMAYTIIYYVYKQLGLEKVAILRANNRYGRFGVAQFRKGSVRMGKPAPIEINYEINYEKVNVDFEMQIERLKKAKPDGVILWADPEPAGVLVKRMREEGLNIPVVACERIVRPEFIRAAGAAAEGVVATYPYDPNSTNPRLANFKTRFQERYGEPPDVYAIHAYDGTQVTIEAIRKAGLNRYRIRDALEATRHWQGISGEINMDDVYTNRRPVTVATVKDGKFVFGIPKLDRVF